MDLALPLVIVSLLLAVGACKAIHPVMFLDSDAEREAGAPTPKALAESRWQGFIMLAFGVVVLYAILTSDGGPPEFIGV